MPDDSPLEFPCDIPVKVFGRNEASFREAVIAIVTSHYGEMDEVQVVERSSRRNRYLSMTITVRAESREQIDALFTELSGHDAILMVL
ncbi:MAG: YbeD family protein [Gammaproteobacteria bacterium]